MLFTLSTASAASLTYGGYVLNKEVNASYDNEYSIDEITSDIMLTKENDNNILVKVIRLLGIITLMLSSDLIMESIFVSIGLNKKDEIGFISAVKSIREDTLRIKELHSQNKEAKEEINKLLTETKELITNYHIILKKLEEEKVVVRRKLKML